MKRPNETYATPQTQSSRRTAMRTRYLGILAVGVTVATGTMMSSLFAQSNDGAEAATTKTCYPKERLCLTD
jgi:hypothetical protein